MTMDDDDDSALKRSNLVAESNAEGEKSAKGFKQPLPLSPKPIGILTSSV